MREIAAELGMHAGNLYYYFENKQALLAFCQEDSLARLLALVDRVRRLDLGADQKLFLLVTGHTFCVNRDLPGSLAHLAVEALEEPWRGKIQSKRDRYEVALRELIEDGVGEGTFRPVDAKIATLAILGALNWTVRWFSPEGEQAIEEIAEEFAEFAVRGLLDASAAFEAPARELWLQIDQPLEEKS